LKKRIGKMNEKNLEIIKPRMTAGPLENLGVPLEDVESKGFVRVFLVDSAGHANIVFDGGEHLIHQTGKKVSDVSLAMVGYVSAVLERNNSYMSYVSLCPNGLSGDLYAEKRERNKRRFNLNMLSF